MSITLDDAELIELTGYERPSRQLEELHRQGFGRARIGRFGRVILERAHYEGVLAGCKFEPIVDYSAIVPIQPSTGSGAERAAAIARRTPAWADRAAIETIYEEARRITVETGIPHHVDHEIPLRGRTVSGLHVETNLRVIPWGDNIAKSNHFTP